MGLSDLPTTTKKILFTTIWYSKYASTKFGDNRPLFYEKLSHNCQLHIGLFSFEFPCLAIRVHSERIFQHEIKDHNAIVNFVLLLGPPSWMFSGALFSRETYANLLVICIIIKIDLFSCFFKQKYANTNFYNKIRIFLKDFYYFQLW